MPPPKFLTNQPNTSQLSSPKTYRDQLIPESAIDLLPSIIANFNSPNYDPEPNKDYARVVKVFTTSKPKVGSVPYFLYQGENITVSHCMAISVNKTNKFAPLPEETGDSLSNSKDKTLTNISIYCFDDKGNTQAPLKVGDLIPIEFVNGKMEARIIGKASNDIAEADGTDPSAKDAHNNGDGSTVSDSSTTPPKIDYNPTNLCKDSKLIVELAKKIGIPPAVMAAFRAVESGGNSSVIRFEPHRFNREKGVTTKVPYTDTGKGFSQVPSETNKSAFERAYAINKIAAVKSTSWGSYQVMGWALLAIPEVGNNPDKAVSLFYSDSNRISQEIAISWFRDSPSAVQYANKLDFSNLASLYNGTLYKNNKYDSKLKQAYEKALADCADYKVK